MHLDILLQSTLSKDQYLTKKCILRYLIATSDYGIYYPSAKAVNGQELLFEREGVKPFDEQFRQDTTRSVIGLWDQ